MQDDKFLFHFLKLCPYLEEESKNGHLSADNFNMAIIEEELTLNF